MRAQECAVNGSAVPKSGAFDEIVNRLGETLSTSRNIANRIEGILLRPVPVEVTDSCKTKEAPPETVADALYVLNRDLVDINIRLEVYAEILQRHFGELKLE